MQFDPVAPRTRGRTLAGDLTRRRIWPSVALGAVAAAGAIVGVAATFAEPRLPVALLTQPWIAVLACVAILSLAIAAIRLHWTGRILGIIAIVATLPAAIFVLSLAAFVGVKPL